MGVSGVLEWWQEWQLRTLVLSSTAIQLLLYLFANRRKHATSSQFRTIIWLSYLGSDAIAIYALATLFNRHKNQDSTSSSTAQGSRILEVVWAPILLIHLGGQDSITAYNIEDNELWKRNVVTMVSQVTVSIYVFCKSWPGGDKRLLQAAILLFVPGVLKCIEKPWALRSASINSLVSSDDLVPRTGKGNEQGGSISLESYVEEVRKFVIGNGDPFEVNVNASDTVGDNHEPYKLFVDLSLPYSIRLLDLKSWWKMTQFDAYIQLTKKLTETFYRLYTKSKMLDKQQNRYLLTGFLRVVSVYLPFAAIGLFHNSHRQAYNRYDIKVTYTILCCTAFVEAFAAHGWNTPMMDNVLPWFYKVSQCRLIGSYAGGSTKSCDSVVDIIELVLQHVKSGWKDCITDFPSYRAFSDHRGQWALRRNNCDQEDLAWSLRVPFDESVLLWHLATDFCFISKRCTNEVATRSIEISNYMMYLLLDNPEMLMAGTRRNLFTTAIHELEGILGNEPREIQGLAQKIIVNVESTNGDPSFIRDACALSKVLLSLGDEKMWKVIKGVWVEMLCFSASRCRGYLHAKSLGTGWELLTFVWLLMLYMGMEPLVEKLQRAEFSSVIGSGTTADAPSSSNETLAEREPKTEVPNGGGISAAAPLSSDETLAEWKQKIKAPSGDEGNIGDVPSTSPDIIVIDIKEDNAS
ncbi:hypothetical protein DAI22_10g022600 [Oryza sativa Japonica Group]|nr:hypothetical protein DAI22_10g022600 [Oryza sativa Japonica Group]